METKPKKTIAPRVDMPCQPADVRAHNFDEVATGYTKNHTLEENLDLESFTRSGQLVEKLIGMVG